MSQFESQQNNRSAEKSTEKRNAGNLGNIEILFERPTAWQSPQEVLRLGIGEAALNGETALFDVLQGIGKSRSISKLSDIMPVSIFTNLRDNYGQFEDWGEKDGIDVERLPVATDLCPVLSSDQNYPDDEAARDARTAYRNGWSVSSIHRELDLPCEYGDETCPYRDRVAEIDAGGLNSLVGHYTQAYNPAYISNRVVAIDEDGFDHYKQEIKNPIEKAEKFIATLDEFPFDSVRRPESGEKQKQKDALNQLETVGLDPRDHQNSIGEFHAKAPLVAYAIYSADRMSNDWLIADLPGDRTATFYDNPHENSLWLFDPPGFSQAEAVIALDASPCFASWTRLLGDDLKHYRLFDDDQRNQYLHEQRYEFIQMNNYIWPVSGGEVSISKCEAYLREIHRKHGQRPDLITSKTVRSKLEDRDLEHLWGKDLHYGALRGKNDLEKSELLVVLGSPGRKDRDIQYQAAFHGECAEPATFINDDGEEKRLGGYDLDYQSEVANEILEVTRRGEVMQAAMRAGRTDDTETTVYIATGMVPDWLETTTVGRERPDGSFDACTSLRSDGEKQVIKALRGADGISASEIAEQVEIGPGMAKKHRRVLQERGLIEKDGERRWARYSDIGVERLNIAGSVDLSLSGNSPYNGSIRGKYPIESRLMPASEPPTRFRLRYADWMLEVMHRMKARKLDEQQRQRWRDTK